MHHSLTIFLASVSLCGCLIDVTDSPSEPEGGTATGGEDDPSSADDTAGTSDQEACVPDLSESTCSGWSGVLVSPGSHDPSDLPDGDIRLIGTEVEGGYFFEPTVEEDSTVYQAVANDVCRVLCIAAGSDPVCFSPQTQCMSREATDPVSCEVFLAECTGD